MSVSEDLAKAMVTLAEAYGVVLTEGRIRVYGHALADLPIEAVRTAMSRAVRECRFFPTVAELRAFVVPNAEDAALIAWTAFTTAASRVGAFQSLEVEDAAAATALRTVFGSWPAFCEVETGPGLAIKRQEFLAAYRDARRSGGGAPMRLPGICEAGGRYDPGHGTCWAGRITSGGQVESGRERPTLAGAPARPALTDGAAPE